MVQATETGTLYGFPSTLEEIYAVPKPETTATWNPLSLGEFVDFLKERLAVGGYRILRESYALKATKGNDHATQLFGVFNVIPEGSEEDSRFQQSIGFRHCIDKIFGYNFIGGRNVMVCDNMEFNGEFDFNEGKAKKHSPSSPEALYELLDTMLDNMVEEYDSQRQVADMFEVKKITDYEASHYALTVCEKTDFPLTKVLDVLREFHYPSFEYDNDPDTLQGLLNAFTHVNKNRKAWNQLDGSNISRVLAELIKEEKDAREN